MTTAPIGYDAPAPLPLEATERLEQTVKSLETDTLVSVLATQRPRRADDLRNLARVATRLAHNARALAEATPPASTWAKRTSRSPTGTSSPTVLPSLAEA